MSVTDAKTYVLNPVKSIQTILKGLVIAATNFFMPKRCRDNIKKVSQTTTSLIQNSVRPYSKVSKTMNGKNLNLLSRFSTTKV